MAKDDILATGFKPESRSVGASSALVLGVFAGNPRPVQPWRTMSGPRRKIGAMNSKENSGKESNFVETRAVRQATVIHAAKVGSASAVDTCLARWSYTWGNVGDDGFRR